MLILPFFFHNRYTAGENLLPKFTKFFAGVSIHQYTGVATIFRLKPHQYFLECRTTVNSTQVL